MAKMTLLDKLGILLEIIKSNKYFLLLIALMIVLAIAFFISAKKSNKKIKKIYILCYGILILIVGIIYHDSLQKMLDYMMNNFFIALYFPNIAIYFAAIITANIILLISIFNKNITKIVRIINITIYCLITYIFILTLNIITTNKLDVFTQESIYGNKNVQALIELSSAIFIVWILFLVVYKLIRMYQNTKEEHQEQLSMEDKEEISSPVIPESTIIIPYQEETVPLEKGGWPIEDIKQQEPISIKEGQKKSYEDLLSLEDYKLLLNILKEHKEKERLKEEKQKQIEEEQKKFRELQELYRSIR